MADTAQTTVDKLREQYGLVYGEMKQIGAVDHSMLEMSDTNRYVYGAWQSELMVALLETHDALVRYDNVEKHFNLGPMDPQTRKRPRVEVIEDNWTWILDLIYLIKTQQLTIEAFSRMQHLHLAAAMTALGSLPANQGGGGLSGWLGGLLGQGAGE